MVDSKDALAQKRCISTKGALAQKKSWLPNFCITQKDEVILCPGTGTYRSDHHHASAQSGKDPGVSPPYMDSELNFRPLYLKNHLTDPRQTWTQASHDQSLSFETKKTRSVFSLWEGGGDGKMGY